MTAPASRQPLFTPINSIVLRNELPFLHPPPALGYVLIYKHAAMASALSIAGWMVACMNYSQICSHEMRNINILGGYIEHRSG